MGTCWVSSRTVIHVIANRPLFGRRGNTCTCNAGESDGLLAMTSTTMKILSIDHIQLAMPFGEENKARAFYLNVLGFTEIPKPAELAKRGGTWFQSEGARLHLGVEQDFRPARKAHPAFIVDELDVLITKAQSAGYETDSSQPPLDGYKRAHIFDPFGNRIEFMQKL